VFLVGAGFIRIGPEFGIGPLGLGLLTAAFFLTASLSSPLMGRWVQRVGWQHAMRLDFRAVAVVLAVVPILAHDAVTLGLMMMVGAVLYGSANPAANQALADNTDQGRQATIFGAKHAGIPMSTLLAGLAVPLVIERFGWRWSFVIAAAVAAGLSLLVPSEVPEPQAAVGMVTVRGPKVKATRRDLVLLAAGSSFATWAAAALGTYLVTATVDLGFTASQAGILQFVGSGTSILARITAGAVTDRRRGAGFAGVAAMTAAGAVVFVSVSVSSGAAYLLLVVAAFATGWGWPGLMTFSVVNASRDSVARSSSITQAGVLVGAGAGPILLGAVIEHWSFQGLWLVVAAGLVVAAVVVGAVGARVTSRRDAPDPG